MSTAAPDNGIYSTTRLIQMGLAFNPDEAAAAIVDLDRVECARAQGRCSRSFRGGTVRYYTQEFDPDEHLHRAKSRTTEGARRATRRHRGGTPDHRRHARCGVSAWYRYAGL